MKFEKRYFLKSRAESQKHWFNYYNSFKTIKECQAFILKEKERYKEIFRDYPGRYEKVIYEMYEGKVLEPTLKYPTQFRIIKGERK